MSYLSNEVACSTMRKRQEKGNLAVGTSRVESERSRMCEKQIIRSATLWFTTRNTGKKQSLRVALVND
jgi:hypothetical protein